MLSSILKLNFSYSSSSDFVIIYLMTGHECESNRNCLEANAIRNEPANISSDLDIYFSCDYLCAYPNELFKQGKWCSFLVFNHLETILVSVPVSVYDIIFVVHIVIS